MGWLQALYLFVRAVVISHAALAAENLGLRQQLRVLEQSVKRPKLRPREPTLLGLALTALARVALRATHRATGHRHHMAQEGLQTVLAMEVEGQDSRATTH